MDKRYIICVGELLPNKNQRMVIEAMSDVVKEYSDVALLLAGNGPEKDSLSSLVCSLNLQNNVKFLGYVTNLEKYQQVSEIAVSCSKREGLGLNLIEAMLVGNPVIGTKNRGHNELISCGVNGYLVEIEDVDSLKDSIISLLKGNNIESIKANAFECGRRYVADKVKEELCHIYSL